MSEIIVPILTAIITSATSLAIVLVNNKKMREDSKDKQNELIQMTLRNTIQGVYAMYRGDGCIPETVYDGLCKMFDRYKEAGGNSYIVQLMKEINEWDRY